MQKKLFICFEVLLFTIILGTLIFLLGASRFYGTDSQITTDGVKTVDGWYYYGNNSEPVSLSLPETVEADSSGKAVIETRLPENISDHDYFSTRLNKTDAVIYVNDELRAEYVDNSEKPFRIENYSRYIFLPVKASDSGQIVRVEFTKKIVKGYSVLPFYLGDKSAEILLYRNSSLPSLILGLALLVIGFCCTLYGITIRITVSHVGGVDYLGLALFLIALWDITQSGFRDLYFTNIKAVSLAPPLCLIGYSLALCLYFNSLQKFRYAKIYSVIFGAGIINVLIAIALQFLKITDIYSDLPVIFAILGIIIIICLWTMIKDWKAGYAQKYKYVFIGTFLMALCGIAQVFLFIFDPFYSSAIGLTLGTFLFVLFAVIHALNNVSELETEKIAALRTANLKGQFLASMSHEIRTPINAILGMNEMILRESKEEDIKAYAVDVDTSGKMLLSLINDILDFSKLESGNMPIVPLEYEVRPLIMSCYNMLKGRATEKGLDLIVKTDGTIPSKLYGDSVRITQIVVNMLSNAVKYTDHGSVTFEMSVEDVTAEWVMLVCRISDTGRGIKEEDIDSLFDKFKRLDEKENVSIEGTGLGLAITKTLVTLMQGTIDVESEYSKGSVFTVRIPQQIIDNTPMGELSIDAAESVKITDSSDVITTSGVKVLAVDDVPVNLKVVKAFLNKMGIEVECACNGDEAIDKACHDKYDLILLDHMMPGKDGIETLHELKALDENPNKETPCIMLTANAIMGAREHFLSEGFDDFLSKPFTLLEIQGIVRKYIPENRIQK